MFQVSVLKSLTVEKMGSKLEFLSCVEYFYNKKELENLLG
jgi:hypothetical protein